MAKLLDGEDADDEFYRSAYGEDVFVESSSDFDSSDESCRW